MITFEYRFDILPGKLREYERYTKGPGKGIWLRFKGVKARPRLQEHAGWVVPQRLVQVDLESLAALEKIFTDPVFRKVKHVFHGLVTHVSDSLLIQVSDKRK